MSKSTTDDPTDIELSILKRLWTAGALSARELHQAVGEEQAWSYSTTRTVLSRMVEKGLLARKDSHGLILFEPGVEKVRTLAGLIRNFATRVLDASPLSVAPMLHSSAHLSPAELKELKALLKKGTKS